MSVYSTITELSENIERRNQTHVSRVPLRPARAQVETKNVRGSCCLGQILRGSNSPREKGKRRERESRGSVGLTDIISLQGHARFGISF